MADINLQFGVGIDPHPSLEHGVVNQVADSVHCKLMLMGASHMIRLADVMGPRTISLAYQGF
jgi:hypothetical protein